MVSYKNKARNRWYHTEFMIDVDYTDDLAFLTNISASFLKLYFERN